MPTIRDGKCGDCRDKRDCPGIEQVISNVNYIRVCQSENIVLGTTTVDPRKKNLDLALPGMEWGKEARRDN